MKTLFYITGLLCLLTIVACKKQSTADPHIEFDMDGTHYSYPLSQGQLQVVNGTSKVLQFSSGVNFSLNAAQIALYEEQSPLNSDLLSTGTYHCFYADATCQDTLSSGCHGYTFMVMSAQGVWMQYSSDSTTTLNVTSCAGNPPVINATFTALIGDPNGGQLHSVTNGKLVNATYIRVP